MNYCIRLYRVCGCLLSSSPLFLSTNTFTTSYLMNNLGIMCLVSWWLVWSRRIRRSATACFFPNTWTTSIYFPVWYHRWWSNFCEFQGQENTTGLSYGLAMFKSCTGGRPCRLVVSFKEIKTCQHENLLEFIRFHGLDMIQASTLQQPQLWPGALRLHWFSIQRPSFRSSPKTITCFGIFQAGCSWKFMKMALQFPFSLSFSHSSRSSSWRA